MKKRVISAFLAALMLLTILPVTVLATEETAQPVTGRTEDLTVDGVGSVGMLLSSALTEEQQEQSEELEHITDLEITDTVATVSYQVLDDDCSVVVALYDDLTPGVMLTSGTAEVTADKTQVEVTFDGTMPELTIEMLNAYIASLPEEQQTQINAYARFLSEEKLLELARQQMKNQTTNATYRGNLNLLSAVELTTPNEISIYPIDFASKEKTVALIEAYNARMRDEGHEERVISYTDYVGALMSSVTTIVNAISYVLIAFVSISLVVSSIMIGIITYISVLERTKEIGILRAMGASKKDVSRVFTAETLIIGFIAGLIGIITTMLLNIPITMIIRKVAGINATAALPAGSAGILVLISMLLTIVAGFIPARMAAKKDPVVALRTE